MECVCSNNVHSSNLETPIKCYYQHKSFHLPGFYYGTFACVYLHVCGFVSERKWSGYESHCMCVLLLCTCICLSLCVPFAVAHIKSSALVMLNSVRTTDGIKSHKTNHVAIFDHTHFTFCVVYESMDLCEWACQRILSLPKS